MGGARSERDFVVALRLFRADDAGIARIAPLIHPRLYVNAIHDCATGADPKNEAGLVPFGEQDPHAYSAVVIDLVAGAIIGLALDCQPLRAEFFDELRGLHIEPDALARVRGHFEILTRAAELVEAAEQIGGALVFDIHVVEVDHGRADDEIDEALA